MQPHNQLKMLENYARSARMLEARGERTLAAKVHEAIDLNLANIQAHAPELYSDAMDAIARGCRQAEGEEAIKVLRDNGLDISVSDLHRKYGLPPYSRPEDVPPFQRVLAADLAEAIRLSPDNPAIRNSLSDLRDQGYLPEGSLNAWGIPASPLYANVEGPPRARKNGIQRRSRAVASRDNHHLSTLEARLMFILHWEVLFKEAGDRKGRRVVSKLYNSSVGIEQQVAETYAALEQYLRSSQWADHPDLNWRPSEAAVARGNGFILTGLKHFSSGAKRAASGAKRVAGSAATDRAISGTAHAAVLGAKAAGRVAGKGVAIVGKGLSDVLHKLRSNSESPAPRRKSASRKSAPKRGNRTSEFDMAPGLLAELDAIAAMYWRAMHAHDVLTADDAGARMDVLLLRIQRDAPSAYNQALGVVSRAAAQATAQATAPKPRNNIAMVAKPRVARDNGLRDLPARAHAVVTSCGGLKGAQRAADDYARAHGYAVADVTAAGKSAYHVYFRGHASDNFGMRMRLTCKSGQWNFSASN